MEIQHEAFCTCRTCRWRAQCPSYGSQLREDYKDFWDKFDREKQAKLSPEQFADLSRTALRGYDACTAGDERFTVDNFFKKLDSMANAKASDIFNGDAFGPGGSPNAKKN